MLQSMTNNPFIHNFQLSLPLKSYSYQGQLTNLHSGGKNIYGQVRLDLLIICRVHHQHTPGEGQGMGGENGVGNGLGRGDGGGFGVGRG